MWGLLAGTAACGDVFINPPRNLTRPSEIVVVTDAAANEASPEYVFVLDTDRAQLVMVDGPGGVLEDLHPDIPGFNGVFLGGQPSGLAARRDGREIIVANLGLGLLQIVCTPFAGLDCPATDVVATVDVGSSPEHVTVAGSHAYVTRPREGLVVEVELDTRRVTRTFDVGGAPRGLAPSADETQIWVTDSAGTSLTRITRATAEQTRVDVGVPTDRVFVSPNPEWVYTLHADKGSILVVNPRTNELENPFPDGPPGAGPDVELLGRATSIAFVSFTAAEAKTLGIGQFAFVSSADGFVYVLATEGAIPHQIANRTPPAIVDGSAVCATADPPPTGGAVGDCPSLQSPPVFSIGATVLAVSEETPHIVDYDKGARFGITFSGGRRVVKTESWHLTHRGSLPGAAPSPGIVREDNIVVVPDVNYAELVVPTTQERVVREGDHFVFVDAPQPRTGVSCTGVATDALGATRLWAISFVPDNPSALRLSPTDGATLPPLSDCYTQTNIAFEVRASSDWVVFGNKAGYQGRARECPRDLPLTNCFPFEYQNPFFRLTLRQGTASSETDMRWSFNVSDGVTGQQVSLNISSGLAGLPRGIAASRRPDKMVYVVDEGDEAILFVDPATLIIERVIR